MNLILKLKNENFPIIGISVSLLIHITIFIAAAFFINLSLNNVTDPSAYVQIVTSEKSKKKEDIIENEKLMEEAEPIAPGEKIVDETIEKERSVEEKKEGNVYFDASIGNADTSNLNQVYKENTLDVVIKYPAGWTFIDQNIKNKLDGVTFWSVKGNYNPPPYVHLEVKEKYLFNPSRFKYSFKMRNYIAHYNDPEELAGQVSQIIYIRTETDEDYSLKLIMKGRDQFESFQPVFFGMVKTFKFGTAFF